MTPIESAICKFLAQQNHWCFLDDIPAIDGASREDISKAMASLTRQNLVDVEYEVDSDMEDGDSESFPMFAIIEDEDDSEFWDWMEGGDDE